MVRALSSSTWNGSKQNLATLLPLFLTASQPSSVFRKLSGSPLSPVQPSMPIWCSPACKRLRYSPHSKLLISALMPTLAKSACISSAMRLALGLYGRCTGIAHRSVEKPLARPASASSFLAAAGSYGSSLIASLYDHWVGGIGLIAATPVLR